MFPAAADAPLIMNHTFSTVHESPHEKVPSVHCEQGDTASRRPSGCIILHILPLQKVPFLFHVCCSSGRGHSSSFTGLFR